jgi:hypothetical protein
MVSIHAPHDHTHLQLPYLRAAAGFLYCRMLAIERSVPDGVPESFHDGMLCLVGEMDWIAEMRIELNEMRARIERKGGK